MASEENMAQALFTHATQYIDQATTASVIAQAHADESVIRQQWAEDEVDARNLISQLTDSIQAITVSSPIKSDEQHALQVENLGCASLSSAQQANKLEAQISKDEAEILRLEAQMGGLQAQVDDMQTKTSEEPPIISMYSYVSKIDWDPSTTARSSIKGNATWKEKGMVQPFNLPSTGTPLFIADSLWDIF